MIQLRQAAAGKFAPTEGETSGNGHPMARLWSRSRVNPVLVETAREVINDRQRRCVF